MDNKQILENIKLLEEQASNILLMKQESIPRRPIVIEFSGSPKSGKSSCINSLDLFLRRNNYRTKVLTERASVCPVERKDDPYFNIWTVSSAISELSELLSNNAKDYDVIILDRGLFDSLCWFEWLNSSNKLSNHEYQQLQSFLTLDRWIKAIDLIYIFTATPEISLKREYANLLTRKVGSIMRVEVLEDYINAINNATLKHNKKFRNIIKIDTSSKDIDTVNKEVTSSILNTLFEYISEKIGYVFLSDIEQFYSKQLFKFNDIFDSLSMNFDVRDKVEQSVDKVQPLPIVIVTNKEKSKILVAKKNIKRTSENSPEKGKTLLYFGGHSREEDCIGDCGSILSILSMTIHREFKEETGVDFIPHSIKYNNPLCIWDKSNEKSKKHIGICYVLEVDFDVQKFNLDSNEFQTEGRGNKKSGKVMDISDISKEYDNLEAWSQLILKEIFNYQKNNLFTLQDNG